MGSLLEELAFRLGRAIRSFRRGPSTSLSVSHVQTSKPGAAAEWDPTRASSNLGVLDLSEAQLTEREIVVTPIGELELPTGEIIACDPLTSDVETPALSRRVKSGRYPVSIFEAQGRVSLAALRFKAGKPVRWELATVSGEDVAALEGDEVYGYSVDAGLGSFMDKIAMKLVAGEQENLKYGDYYGEVLATKFALNQDRFLMHQPVAGNSLNIAMFSSGWGDGSYPSFWGLDAAGEPVVLMTDFGVLENADGRESE